VSKASRWKKIFGLAKKPTITVQVGDKAEDMTDTQAYRFEELTQTSAQELQVAGGNPLAQSRYSLEDTAFRLMTDEADILQRAAGGSIRLYANAAGLAGRWRRLDGDGGTIESSLRTLRSGYLELTIPACKELALRGGTNVMILALPSISNPSALNLDVETLQELSAWGGGKKCFCLSKPRRFSHTEIVLLAT